MNLLELANRDPLTGLLTRDLFLDFATQAISRAARQGSSMAILVIDLDGFSAINSEFGRVVGDKLLQAVARRLKDCTRQSDTLCRLGGDQFAVLVEQVKSSRALQPLLKKVIARLSRPVNIGGARCCVAVSMGVALYPEDGAGAAELLSRADEARYAVKRSHIKNIGVALAHKELPDY